ncbi:MlaD family protein [Nocardia sp. NPDC057272]|uniref:MlaD family protein n=1 Tax=Nocardia sp. NPDC057272 TaxID=3346079 RepID=UPI003638513F
MTRLRTRTAAAAAALSVLAVSGCGFDPAAVPLPGTSVSGETYPLHLEFADVLNLPPGAKLIADGVEVGKLTGVTVTDVTKRDSGIGRGFVVADVAVQRNIKLPADIQVELRQTTPLGDVYIAVTTPPRTSAPALASGATVPMTQTTRAPQIEDTMAGLATSLGSGMVTDLQDTVRQLNAALPQNPADTARVFGVIGTDLSDVANDLGSLDALLDGLDTTVSATVDMLPTLQPMLTDEGTPHLVETVQAVIGIIFIFANLGPVAHSALFLAPTISASNDLVKATVPMLFGNRPLDLSSRSNMSTLVDLIQNKIIPFVQQGPKASITAAAVGDPAEVGSAEQTTRIVDSLRMIGVVR